MSKRIQSHQKDQIDRTVCEVDFAEIEARAFAAADKFPDILAGESDIFKDMGIPLRSKGPARPQPTKQTALAKRLALYIQCYQYLLDNHQRVLTHPNYQGAPNLLAFSFFNLRSNCTCIIELDLLNPRHHIRMRYLTPKHKNKAIHQTLYIESILTITKFINYV